MNHRILSALIALAFLAAVPSRSAMQAQSVVSAGIVARAAQGPVRVMVRLNVPVVAEAAIGEPGAVAVQRSLVARAQDSVLSAVGQPLEAVTRFQIVPGFAATVTLAALRELETLPNVVAIEEDHISFRTLAESSEIIKATDMWALGVDGSGWKIAVLDDGVDKNHQFLEGRVTDEACFSTTSESLGATSNCPGGVSRTNNPGSARPCPGCDHGTHVAGIAAGRALPGSLSVAGVARGANLVAVQVFSAVSGTQGSYQSDQIQALEHILTLAGANNAGRIAAVNMSLGSGEFSSSCDAANTLFKQAVDNLRAVGIPTIVASGNDGFLNALSLPACVSSVISVGSSDKNPEAVSTFSNQASFLSLLAPGRAILSSGLANGFVSRGGTSMAAPHVAGAWALLKSLTPNASVDQVLRALQLTGAPVYDFTTNRTYPRIAVDRAAGSLGPDGSPSSVVVKVTGSNVTASWNAPFNGISPAAYRVEISLETGEPVAMVNVGSDRVFATTLPVGRYRLRVRTIESSGLGNVSNDLPFVIGTPPSTQVPLAPQDLRVQLFNNVVTLAWNVRTGSPAPTGFIVDVGTAPSLSNFGSFATGSAATTLTASPPTAAGSFYIRVRAWNQFGVSGPSNEVVLNITTGGGGPCTAPPAPPAALTATVVGSLVTLNWTQPVTSGAITGYVLEAGMAPGSTDVLSIPLGVTTIFSGVASPGVYYVRVRANNACGASPPSNEVQVVVP